MSWLLIPSRQRQQRPNQAIAVAMGVLGVSTMFMQMRWSATNQLRLSGAGVSGLSAMKMNNRDFRQTQVPPNRLNIPRFPTTEGSP